jgi:hypothetical protein
MDKYFLSTDNIKNVSNQVFQSLNLNNNISSENKTNTIRKILTVMQTIYQNMDKSKITNRNMNKAIEIFNNKAISSSISQLNTVNYNRETINELQQVQQLPPRPDTNVSNRQQNYNLNQPVSFQRDKEIYGNRNIIVNDRNQQNIRQPNPNQQFINNNYSNRQFTNTMPQQQFNDSLQREQFTNGLNNKSRMNDQSIDDRMKELQSRRMMDVPEANRRPPDIDFSLPFEGKNKTQNQYKQQQPKPILNQSSQKPQPGTEFFNEQINKQALEMNQQKSITGFNDGVSGVGMDPNVGDLNSLENYNLGLTQVPSNVDNGSFEQRLKQIESERSNIDSFLSQQPKPQSKKVSFDDENFSQLQNQQQMNQQQMNQQQMRQSQQYQQQMNQQQMNPQQMRQSQQYQQQMNQQQMRQSQQYQQQMNQQQMRQSQQQMNQQQMAQPQRGNQSNNDIFFLNQDNTDKINSDDNLEINDGFNINNDKQNEETQKLYNQLEEYYNKLQELNGILIERDRQILELTNLNQQNNNNLNDKNKSFDLERNQLNNTINSLELSNNELKNNEKILINNINKSMEEIQKLKEIIAEKEKVIDDLIKQNNNDKLLLKQQLDEIIQTQNDFEQIIIKNNEKEQLLLQKEKELKEMIINNNININPSENLILNYTKIINNNNTYEYNLSKPLYIDTIKLSSYLTSKPFNITNINSQLDLFLYCDKNTNDNLVSDDSGTDDEDKYYRNIQITVPNGYYEIKQLLDYLNDNLRKYNVLVGVSPITNIVFIECKYKFKMFKNNNSILETLGFNNSLYESNLKYSSENVYLLNVPKMCKFKLNDMVLGDILLGTKEHIILNNNTFALNKEMEKLKFTIEDDNGNKIYLQKPYNFTLNIKTKLNIDNIPNYLNN